MGVIKKIRKSLSKLKQQDIYSAVACHSQSYWLGIVLVTVVITRYIGRSLYLYDTDSALYALALNNYDISIQQPHPPGYPLYVLLAKFFDLVVNDANLALVLVSILFSVLATGAVFQLARKIYGNKVAWISLLLFVSAPLVWFHGQVALNYMSDAFFSAWFGWHIYDALQNKKISQSSLLKSSLILAMGAGFRPTLAIFLLPLWLWGIIRQKNVKIFLVNLGLIAGVVLLWLIPEIILSGGIVSFWNALKALIFVKSGIYSFSIFVKGVPELVYHLQMIMNNLWISFSLALVLAALWILSFVVPERESKTVNVFNLIFWLFWIVPSLLFYLIVIFNLPGYLLIIFPAVTILVSKAIVELVSIIITALPLKLRQSKFIYIKMLAVVVIFCVGINTFVYLQPQSTYNFNKPVHRSIDQSNLLWHALISTISREFNPQNTIIGVNQPFVHWGFSQFQYYFPEYETYSKIFWGFYNPENKNWFMAYHQQLQLLDKIKISPIDTKMIVIQNNWVKLGSAFSSLVLDNGVGELNYYDFTDPAVRKLVSNFKDIQVIND